MEWRAGRMVGCSLAAAHKQHARSTGVRHSGANETSMKHTVGNRGTELSTIEGQVRGLRI
jgi:hypothetical protein